MYRQAARGVHAGQVQDLGQDWSAQNRVVVAVLRAAPARARLPAAAAVRAVRGRALPRAAPATTATERQAAGRRVGNPVEEDSWQADSWQAAAAGNRAAEDRAAAAGHPERSMADAAGRRRSSRIAQPPERPSQSPQRR